MARVELEGPDRDAKLPNTGNESKENGWSFKRVLAELNAMLTELYESGGGGGGDYFGSANAVSLPSRTPGAGSVDIGDSAYTINFTTAGTEGEYPLIPGDTLIGFKSGQVVNLVLASKGNGSDSIRLTGVRMGDAANPSDYSITLADEGDSVVVEFIGSDAVRVISSPMTTPVENDVDGSLFRFFEQFGSAGEQIINVEEAGSYKIVSTVVDVFGDESAEVPTNIGFQSNFAPFSCVVFLGSQIEGAGTINIDPSNFIMPDGTTVSSIVMGGDLDDFLSLRCLPGSGNWVIEESAAGVVTPTP